MRVRVEIKEEECLWYRRTGNIVLDYLSAFTFKEERLQKLYFEEMKFWVNPEHLQNFMTSIHVKRYGKLFTCDAHIQIFYVECDSSVVLCQAYDNSVLTSREFRSYIESRYRLRINNKAAYALQDNWQSASYPIPPSDSVLQTAVVDNMEALYRAWRSLP